MTAGFTILFASLLLTLSSYAADSLSTKIRNPYENLRAMGMGNAFTAVADDYSLIFYNPAGFANKKNNEIQMSLLGAGIATKTMTLVKDMQDAANNTVGTDEQKATAISNVLSNYYGQALGGKLQALEFFWVRKGFGYAVLPIDLSVDLSINRQLGPAIDLNIVGDSTFALGTGWEIFKNFDFGISGKYVHRISVEQSVSALELATNSDILSKERFKEGTALDFDMGVLWKPNWFGTKTVKKESVVKKEEIKAEATEIVKDEVKKEEIKAEEKTAEEKTAEEKRDPQAEGDAKEVKIGEEKALTPEGEGAVADVSKDVVKAENADVVTEPKLEPKEEVKTEEVVVETEEERFPLTFGATIHNVIGGEFKLSKIANKDATEVPTKMYRVLDIGSQYRLYDGEDFVIRYMLDFHNIMHPEITLGKSLHTGIEFDYTPSGWFKTQFRLGFNQLYYTAGLTGLFGVFQADIVTYGEEVGTASTRLENRVYALKLAMNF